LITVGTGTSQRRWWSQPNYVARRRAVQPAYSETAQKPVFIIQITTGKPDRSMRAASGRVRA
jgi:hypothetical protein